MNENMFQFEKGLEILHITLTEIQKDQFVKFYERLVEKNKVMNLTAITEWEDVVQKHFLDSLSLVRVLDLNQIETLIDVGTGAGFPGIPLKIAFPHLKITLMDSLNKRIRFLEEVIQVCELEEIEAIHSRAEDLAKNQKYRENYDLCVSRAVANLSSLSEYCLPFVKIGGKFISYKSAAAAEETVQAQRAIEILGGKKRMLDQFQLPDSDISRALVVVDKVKKCSKKYPRKAGMVTSQPL